MANTAPTAKAKATPAAVLTGVKVQLSAAGSTDKQTGTTGLKYSWNFGNGGTTADSTSPHPLVSYSAKGRYRVVLTVTDPQGAKATSAVGITVFQRVDCQAGKVTRTGPWRTVKAAKALGGSYCDNQGKGTHAHPDTLSLTFTSTVFRLDFAKLTGGGTAEIYIDGRKKKTISFSGSSAKPTFGSTVIVKGLSDKQHTVTVEVTGKAAVDTLVY